MADIRDKSFLALCVARGLLSQAKSDRLYQQAVTEDRRCTDLVVELGILTRAVVDVLLFQSRPGDEPQLIGGYRIVRRLGRGGSATVYLAEPPTGPAVALKLMSSRIVGERDAKERFLREARLAASISHPHIVAILAVGQHEGQPWMALELVTGGDAARQAAAAGGRLDEARALALIHDCALGLSALHGARLLHRDIKPANILIDAAGRAKLADLGLARSHDGDDRVTSTGMTVGTPAFMSPEQARADPALDVRGDLYALAASLFALLTGKPPFRGSSALAVAAQVLTAAAPDPAAIRPDLQAETVALIRRNLAKDPRHRAQDPGEFRALERAQAAVGARDS